MKKGFTLIELLVVVAIIGILATVVLSSLGQARQKAKQKKWLASINSLRQAVELHHIETGSYPSSFEYYPSNTGYDGGRNRFKNQMDSYFNLDSFILNFPKGVTSFIYYGVYTTEPSGGSAARCPGQDPANPGQTYAITFDTQGIGNIAPKWQHSTSGVYNLYCVHS